MPQKKSAEKALRKTQKRTERNDSVRKNLDYLFHQFKKAAIAKDKTKAEEISKKLIKSLDKAAEKNVIHKNKAARKKSAVTKKTNNLKQ